MKKENVESFGAKMFDTHDGLSNLYEVSCKELDCLIKQTKRNQAKIGARMIRGGFDGCTINIVKDDKIESLIHMIKYTYEKVMGLQLTYCIVSIQDGTSLILKIRYN